MNKKLILGIFVFLLIGLIFVFAQEQKSFEYRVILNCRMEGHSEETCDMVIGNMFEISLKEGEDQLRSYVVFPEDFEEQLNMRSYPRDYVNCEDPTQITVAKLVDEKWVPITERIPKIEQLDGGGLQVEVLIEEPGIYAVVEETPEIHNQLKDTGIDTSNDYCKPLRCGNYKAYSTDPYDGNVKENNKISFEFCGMVDGCQAGVDESCSNECFEGSDPNCAPVCEATVEGGDCCNPKSDNICDGDCWINKSIIFGEEIVYDAVDPDCLKESYVELYEEVPEYEDMNVLEISEDNLGNPLMVKDGRVNHAKTIWKDFDIDFDEPILIDGTISFAIIEEDNDEGIWFSDFSYTDLKNNEIKLFPLHPMPLNNGKIANSGFSINDIFVDKGNYWRLQEVMASYPYLWFMSYQDSEDEEYGKIQFELPPTGVKKISFKAASDEDQVRSKFKIYIEAHEGNADPDGDGFSNYEDCHDLNPNIYPGALELCNDLDDNCNSFFPQSIIEKISPEEYEQKYNFDPLENIQGWERSNRKSYHYLMPCDGFLEFNSINDQAYMEIWKKDPCIPGCQSFEEDGHLGVPTCGDDKSTSCDAEGINGIWNSYQVVVSYGDDMLDNPGWDCAGGAHQGITCGICDNNNEFDTGPAYDCNCIIGAHASCKGGALLNYEDCAHFLNLGYDYIGSDEDFRFYTREGERIIKENKGENRLSKDYLDKKGVNSPETRIELKEGEMIWSYQFKGCGACASGTGTDCDSGEISFNIYCYDKEYPIQEINVNVDENVEHCEQKEVEDTEVHVCSTDWFDFDKKECIDETLCSFSTKTYEGGCEYLTEDAELEKEFYTYVCKADQDCYLFYKDTFNVCTETEVCDSRINLDQNCDGLLPYEPYENKEGGDPTKPLDPDCEGKAQTGVCNIEDKTWFNGEKWTAESYCLQCGTEDSTCQKLCDEEEASCEGGCWQDACDISANKWCKDGAWTGNTYCSKCGLLDKDCFSTVGNTCEPGACEIVEDRSCFMDSWLSSDAIGEYCVSERCNAKDSDCGVTCEENTCDIHKNKYCSNGAWTDEDYCLNCGAQDYDCGSIACTQGTCDYVAKKVCQSGSWILPTKDNYCWSLGCAEVDPNYCTGCIFTEGQENQETSCGDGLDNDCDGYTDCRDSDCPSDLPECSMPPCTPETEQSCGSNAGWCEFGTQTCGIDGAWGDCVGAITPEIETCNNEDDDCDDSIDEGCVCADGETRLCGQATGSCAMGIQECNDGSWGLCFGSGFSSPQAEVCDGIDNDCDEEIDEGCGCVVGETQDCGTDVGICQIGTQTCLEDAHWGLCENGVLSLPEICGDGLDNDCDGSTDTDEECSITETLSPSCFDQIQNQGEDGLDCGGDNCAPCSKVSCNDRLMNGNEEGIDCGGSCSISCSMSKKIRTGASDESDYGEDTGIIIECGDGFCDAGEEGTCPKDCDEGSSFMSYLLPLIIILALIGGAFFAYKKGLIKVKGKDNATAKPSFKFKTNISQKPVQGITKPMFRQQTPIKRKTFKSKEELALEKSLKEQQDLLKK